MTDDPRRLILRDPEAAALAATGRVEVWRPFDMPPCDLPGAYFDAYNGGPVWCWWTADNRRSRRGRVSIRPC